MAAQDGGVRKKCAYARGAGRDAMLAAVATMAALQQETCMRWIVGLDLEGLSQGAIHFARWLHTQDRGARFVGVHAVEAYPAALREIDVAPEVFQDWALAATERELAKAGAREIFEDVALVRAVRAEDGLNESLAAKGGEGLIVGRKAGRGQEALVRLGRVVRRLIREANGPLIVVPPDLLPQDIGAGPVVVATDVADDSVAALRFAQAMAQALGRELVLAYGVAVPSVLEKYLPSDAWDGAQRAINADGEAASRAWAARHGVKARTLVVAGPLVRGLWSAAVREQACLLVCGSRRLSLVERIFTSSVGSELAASAPLAVAVVPPSAPAE